MGQLMNSDYSAHDKYKNIFEEVSVRLPGFSTFGDFWAFNLGPPAPMTRDEAFSNITRIKKNKRK